jgi:hypothetical protein
VLTPKAATEIGRNSDGSQHGWVGWIDEFRMSNSARYTSGFTPQTEAFTPDANTLLLLHMDGADGSTTFINDRGRQKVGVTAVNQAQIDTAQSKFGGSSALFDGIDDYLRGAYNTNFAGDFTIECWARFNDVDTDQTIWQFGNDANDAIQIFLSSGTDIIRLDIWGRTGVNTTYTVTHSTWYHFAVVRSGSTITLYIDGVNRASLTRSQTIGNGGDLYIGIRQGGAFDFDGHIDEFRISNTARYTTTFTPDSTPFQNDANTVLLLHMDGTDGSTDFVDDNGKESA